MKLKILFFVFILSCFLIIFIKYKNCKDNIRLINFTNNHLTYRLNLFNDEKEIQKRILGKKLNFPKNLSFSNKKNTILIVENELANKKSFYDALKFYQNILKEKHFINTNIIAVIPTKNLGYIKSFSLDFSQEINFFADTTFFFKRELDIQEYENIVILVDDSGICLYTYLLEIDNPLRDINESKIILNFLIKNEIIQDKFQ